MKYQWILFDADETLYDFPSFEGLKRTLAPYGIDLTPQELEDYEKINQPLWIKYQQQKLDIQDLKRLRFMNFSERTGIDPLRLNDEFGEHMANVSKPLPNTMETLELLKNKVFMGIITNGCVAMQELRLAKTHTANFFKFVLSSEEAGIPKPNSEIFAQAFQKMQQIKPVNKNQILMVGDSLSSDIAGGNAFGVDTCWLNRNDNPEDFTIKPTYTIKNISELIFLL